MMRIVWAATFTACAAFLAGCAAPVSQQTYAAQREALIGSATFYQKEVAQCVTQMRRNPQLVENLAALASVSTDRAPEVVCDRFVKALRDGKYTYEKYVEATKGINSPELVRIAQGR